MGVLRQVFVLHVHFDTLPGVPHMISWGHMESHTQILWTVEDAPAGGGDAMESILSVGERNVGDADEARSAAVTVASGADACLDARLSA